MATFGEMRTKLLARLRRRDCDNDLADGFIQDAVQRTQRSLRIPAMERVVIRFAADACHMRPLFQPFANDDGH